MTVCSSAMICVCWYIPKIPVVVCVALQYVLCTHLTNVCLHTAFSCTANYNAEKVWHVAVSEHARMCVCVTVTV